MISGAHMILYSVDAEADRKFFRDVLKFPNVNVGEGWLIFALPPSELAVHPDGKPSQEIYLMCDSIRDFTRLMKRHNIACAEVRDQGYGLVTSVTLPGGGRLGVYEPRHARPAAQS